MTDARETPHTGHDVAGGIDHRDTSLHDGTDLIIEMRRDLEAQRSAFLAGPPPTADVRVNRIDRVIDLITANADALVDAIRADYGQRSRSQSLISDVLGPLPALEHTRANVRKWMRPERHAVGPMRLVGSRARVDWQPLGVVGVISPWNFPIGLTFDPVAQAFAAGNRAMIKMSELVPRTAALVQREVAYRFDPEELTVITGGPAVGAAFASMPFDHLLFTGSTATGRLVQRSAAEHLVPVTLELGGKDPVILTPGADLSMVADRVLAAKTMNAGQLCLAPDYVLLAHRDIPALLDALQAAGARMYPDGLVNSDDFSSIVSARHRDRLRDLVDDARARGARVVHLGPAGEDFSVQPPSVHKVPLTVLLDVEPDMAVMQEEIFGPILPLIGVSNLEEAVAFVNRRPKPLAAYVFGDDDADRAAVVDRVLCGGMTINDCALHFSVASMPFGGVGESGMGGYHGRAGFETFSHARGVLEASRRWSPGSAMSPPYTTRKHRMLRAGVRVAAWNAGRRLRRSAVARSR